MKDLGFNEFGELADGVGDEENLQKAGVTELTAVTTSSSSGTNQVGEDPDGDEEAENAEIAI